MTMQSIYAVGFCAHYSQPGDWAFDYALRLSQNNGLQLNVFHFLTNPYIPGDTTGKNISAGERKQLVIDRERELRMYYDKRSGDFLDVGFRLCEDNEWTELHRCLLVREFQVLVLPNISPGAVFAGRPINEFADSFVSPVVLVGPDRSDQLRLNSRAALIADRLELSDCSWEKITTATG
ncbi:MAG: hypothetical protein GY841_04700 [FCB group bacterium]|nr:hypothetical protein [FCB group bacterium]